MKIEIEKNTQLKDDLEQTKNEVSIEIKILNILFLLFNNPFTRNVS